MSAKRFWIIAPTPHRAHELRNVPPDAIRLPDDVWFCDRCDALMDSAHPIPVEGLDAICLACAGLTLESTVGDWSAQRCDCPPCVAAEAKVFRLAEILNRLR
jgi:hypothetical protein